MQKCEATMDEYIKLYNQTLKLFKIAKEEFNKITCNSFDKEKFEEIRSKLNNVHFNLTMCHYIILNQNQTLSNEEQYNLAKYYNLHNHINQLSQNYNNYLTLLKNACYKSLIEDEEEIIIN